MKVREYDVLSRAVEEGISFGISRADKYEAKTEDAIKQHIYHAVMNAICEVFDFDEVNEDL